MLIQLQEDLIPKYIYIAGLEKGKFYTTKQIERGKIGRRRNGIQNPQTKETEEEREEPGKSIEAEQQRDARPW